MNQSAFLSWYRYKRTKCESLLWNGGLNLPSGAMKPMSHSAHPIYHYFLGVDWKAIFSIAFSTHRLLVYFCVGGVFYQSYILLKDYFDYKHISVISMYIPIKTQLPDPVVCFEISYMINYTKLYEKYPELAKVIKNKYKVFDDPEPIEEFRRNLFRKVTPTNLVHDLADRVQVREMTELLYPRDQLVKSTVIRGQRGDDEEEDDGQSEATCSVEEYYKEYSICYTFVCSKNRTVYFTIADKEKSPLSLPLFRINFNQMLLNLIPTFYVTLVEPNTLPRGQILKWVTFNTDNRSMRFVVHFYVFHSILLPSPYETQCKNYSLYGFKSRIDMRDQCLEVSAMNDLGVSFHTAVTNPNLEAPFAFVSYLQNRKNGAYLKQFKEIVNHCDNLSKQPDCDIKYYITQRKTPEHMFRNESELVIDHIRQPNIRVELQPKMKLVDCIILVGSVISTWFGWSVYYHLPKLISLSADSLFFIRNGQFKRPLKVGVVGDKGAYSVKLRDLKSKKSRQWQSYRDSWYTGFDQPHSPSYSTVRY